MEKNTTTADIEKRIIELCIENRYRLPEELSDEVAKYQYATKMKKADIDFDDLILNLSVRAVNVISQAGCETIADILALGIKGFEKQRNCGKKTIVEIRNQLMERGLALPYESGKVETMVAEEGMVEKRESDRKANETDEEKTQAKNFIIGVAADSMFAQIRRAERSKFDAHSRNLLKQVASEYEMARRGIFPNL